MIELPTYIENKIEYEPNTGYWIWIGCCDPDEGRAILRYKGKTRKAARVIYELFSGQFSTELCVLHTCDNPSCVNPKHLYLGTQYQNIQDRVSRNRNGDIRGEKHPRVKLTEQQVLEIRQSNLSYAMTAKKFNVSKSSVARIKKKLSWSHL